jgi:hypothetical protein
MKRTLFALLASAAMISSAAAAEVETSRSFGAHPVVYDDYPESDVVLDVGPDIVLTVTGEARTRFEWVENATDFSSDGRDGIVGSDDDDAFDDSFSYAPARFNLGIRADLPRDVAAVIELQGNFELGGGPFGTGTELRAQTTQHQRPGVINPQLHGAAFSRVGGLGGALGDGTNPQNGPGNIGGPGTISEPSHLELVRVLNDIDGDGVFVYQGYIETAHIGDSIFSLRFGRQELAYGTEWLLGNQDFYDGQTFDGIKGILEFSDNLRLDFFWAKLAERDTTLDASLAGGGSSLINQDGDDSDLYGAYFSAQCIAGSSIGIDAYIMGIIDDVNLEYDVDTFDVDGDGDTDLVSSNGYQLDENDGGLMNAWWLGARVFREREHGFHFSAEGTYLFGSIENELNGNEGNFDLNAWGFEGHLGWTWDTPTNPTIRGGFTYASGTDEDDFADGDYKTFFTPAGEVHPRLGLMDIVDASNVWAANIGYTGSFERHSWGVDLWHFEMAETDPIVEAAFIDPFELADGDEFDEELGNEVDLFYNYQYSEHMVAHFAVGYFDAGDFIEERNRCGSPDGNCDVDAPEDPNDSIQTDNAWRVFANLLVRF